MPSALRLAPYVLRELFRLEREGCARDPDTLDAVARAIGSQRASVRTTVSLLHRIQLVDALRMRLTPAGFAIASLVSAGRIPPLAWSSELLLS